MTILLIGGSGKTPSRIARILLERNIPVVLTSRRGQAGIPAPFRGVAFDWKDRSTYANPFDADAAIDRVYFVIPPGELLVDSFGIVKDFIDFAREKGVKRFVTISAALIAKGESIHIHGQTHEYLATCGVDYCVLRPSTFFENFVVFLAPLIRTQDMFPSATGTGKIGFISSDDIAEAAVSVLTDEPSHNTEHIIFGPDLLSFDEVAELLTQVLGRKITHKKITVEEKAMQIKSMGAPEDFAKVMAQGDAMLAAGTEEKLYKDASIPKIIGKKHLKDFFEANKAVWMKDN